MKAVSQNLMHSNLSITDGVYGILSDDDVGKKIKSLGRINNQTNITTEELISKLEAIVTEIKQNK